MKHNSSRLREASNVIECRQKVIFCSFLTFVERMQTQSARRVYEIENLNHYEPSVVIKVLQNSKGYSTQLTINICPSDKKALRHRPLLYHRLLEYLLFTFENQRHYCT